MTTRVYQGVVQPEGFPGLPEDWVSEWETFPSSDGKLQLFAVTHHLADWNKARRHRGLVVIHGMGEHGGRYLHFPHYLKSAVDSVFCLDHRGHGRSEGLRGDVENFGVFASDLILAINRFDEHLRRRFGSSGSEIHLMAHSMGGLIALDALFANPDLPLKSVTISAPLLGVRVPVPAGKKVAAAVLSKVWGALQMTSEIDAKHLSHDPAVAEAYRADRLVHGKITPRFYMSMLKTMASVLKKTANFNYPLQAVIPLQDQIVDPDIALRFYRGLKARDKQLRTYSDFFHESFNELETGNELSGKAIAFEDLKSWILEHS